MCIEPGTQLRVSGWSCVQMYGVESMVRTVPEASLPNPDVVNCTDTLVVTHKRVTVPLVVLVTVVTLLPELQVVDAGPVTLTGAP